ncbi:hypothetical protein ACTXT7_001015 [Hymenolepis weldensis]
MGEKQMAFLPFFVKIKDEKSCLMGVSRGLFNCHSVFFLLVKVYFLVKKGDVEGEGRKKLLNYRDWLNSEENMKNIIVSFIAL